MLVVLAAVVAVELLVVVVVVVFVVALAAAAGANMNESFPLNFEYNTWRKIIVRMMTKCSFWFVCCVSDLRSSPLLLIIPLMGVQTTVVTAQFHQRKKGMYRKL